MTDLLFQDLDGDGRDELAVTGGGSNELALIRWEEGREPYVAHRMNGLSRPQSVRPWPLNSGPVLAVSLGQTSEVTQINWSLTGGLKRPLTYSLLYRPQSAFLADYTNDGIRDMLALGDTEGTLTLLEGRNDGEFQPPRVLELSTGVDDVLLYNYDGSGGMELLTLTPLSLRATLYRILASGSVFPVQNRSTGREPTALTVGRWDDDRYDDIAFINRADNTVGLYLSGGAPGLNRAAQFHAGARPAHMAVQDIDNDGRSDFFIALEGERRIKLVLGRDFTSPISFDLDLAPVRVAVGEMNGDGVPDFATFGHTDSRVILYLSTPAVAIRDWGVY